MMKNNEEEKLEGEGGEDAEGQEMSKDEGGDDREEKADKLERMEGKDGGGKDKAENAEKVEREDAGA